MDMTSWQAYLDQHQEQYLNELMDFLRTPSISALPDHAPDVRRAAEWAAKRMQAAGLEKVEVMPTCGHPVVYGEWLHAPGQPTILIYGHVDTQPVDPLAEWTSPPFEPVVRDGRIYARGATDDKGNLLGPILATEALLKTEGKLPINVKFFVEGEEEIGSPSAPALLEKYRDRFACDMVFSADSAQWSEEQPLLFLSWRGMCGLQIDVRGANQDLHSGLYGGAVQNPIHALVRILDSMRSPDGQVLIQGFYDDVRPLSPEQRAHIRKLPHDETRYKRAIGVSDLFGEPGYSTLERIGTRPTLEVNGVYGGFQGEGSKTVIPAEAHAKITCRLVADQDPVRIRELIVAHIAEHTPAGVTVTTQAAGWCTPPYLIGADHPGNQAARAVLEQIYGKTPYYVWNGGTLPANALFHRVLGAYAIGFAFFIDDERAHAPDEFFRLSSFRRAQQAYGMLLQRLRHAEG